MTDSNDTDSAASPPPVVAAPTIEPGPFQPPGTNVAPLSVQASALVRSIDSLSTIFWIMIGGAFLSVLFSGLVQLEINSRSDYLYLGEYQVPKSILPLVGSSFALFVFWLTSNRLRMLHYVLSRSEFPNAVVRDLFRLNPPLFSVFSRDNYKRYSVGNGTAVLIIIWAIYFGNSLSIALRSTLQASATSSQFDVGSLAIYGGLMLITGGYGIYAISKPLAEINEELHDGRKFKIGWPRYVYGLLVVCAVMVFNNSAEFDTPDEENDLLGPAFANAIDGGSLYMSGLKIELIGLRPLEVDKLCQDAAGEDYPCGRQARRFLQSLVQSTPVLCAPLFSNGIDRLTASCRLHPPDTPMPASFVEFFNDRTDSNLSRQVVAKGYALVSGIGRDGLAELQEEAQRTRQGVWAGSFDPN